MAEAIAFDIAGGVISKLSSLALQQIGLWWNLKDDIDDLHRIVSLIKDVILDAEEQSVTSNAVKGWLERLKDALYDADDLLDDFSTEALRKDLLGGNKLTKEVRTFFSRSNQFSYGHKMGRRIKAIKARLNSIKSETSMLQLVKRERPVESSFMAKRRQQTHSFVRRDEIIGRDDDKKSLLKLLLESQIEENVVIIPIVGIGGLGKTALAQLVYNDEKVKDRFELRMWVCVSDVFDVKIIVENIIKSATNKAPDQNLEMDQLQKQLRENIDGRRYLLVLDDVWNDDREKWFSLKKLLMDGAKGSRIIVTSRSLRVAKITSNCPPHVLKGLADDDAWLLFKQIAFEQRPADSTNPNFVETGKKILEKCGGVPLVIRTIAGTLSFKETESDWLSFKDNELAKVSQKEGEILPTLKLSYDHLPSHLKHCFAYCRLYPKDHEIDVPTMIQLWIALGFVKLSNDSNPSQSLEDIGLGYFKDLVERSFFQEVETISQFRIQLKNLCWYRITICKMHDLMHDLAETVAGIESTVFDSESSTSEIDEKCRHLSIDSSLISSHEILIPFSKAKKLRTLFCTLKYKRDGNMSKRLISNFRCLRVLDLVDFNLSMVPRSIHKLKHLRYLDLSDNDQLKTLPKSICKLQNLLVLKLDGCTELEELPKNFEKLVNLTQFGLEYCTGLTHMPRGIGKLTSLQTLSMFVVDKHGSKRHSGGDLSELSGLNNLRGDLRITNLEYVKDAKNQFRAANLKKKQHLEWLALEWTGDNDDDEKSLEDLQPHLNLKALSVKGWRGDAKIPSWLSLLTNLVMIEIVGPSKFKHLPTFAHLRHLEALSIDGLTELEYMDDDGVDGRQGESELFFPSLTHLSLAGCPNMKSWWRRRIDGDNNYDGTSTKAFPRLSFLYVEDCPLTSMPLYRSLQESLTLKNTSSRSLQQTIRTSITSTTPSTSSLPLSKLKYFDVENIEELDSDLLDECLQNMTSLKSLGIGSCHWLKSLYGLSQHLTRLKSLNIGDCKELDLEGMQWEPLGNLSSLTFRNIPRLLSLPFWLQDLSELKELKIKNCSGLKSLFPVFQHLTFLQELEIIGCNDLELSAPDIQIFQDYTSLRSLRLERIPNCRYLPEWLRHLTNLHVLVLNDLPNLTLLPENMRALTTLETLYIWDIPQLKERCQKGGADWPKIAHIPSISVF
ncbi:hypothetical protein REPUB_Repub09cG0173300 [Reevesia pubescens]